jgi:hypothetical protein
MRMARNEWGTISRLIYLFLTKKELLTGTMVGNFGARFLHPRFANDWQKIALHTSSFP